jgi:hypothetical protein
MNKDNRLLTLSFRAGMPKFCQKFLAHADAHSTQPWLTMPILSSVPMALCV